MQVNEREREKREKREVERVMDGEEKEGEGKYAGQRERGKQIEREVRGRRGRNMQVTEREGCRVRTEVERERK